MGFPDGCSAQDLTRHLGDSRDALDHERRASEMADRIVAHNSAIRDLMVKFRNDLASLGEPEVLMNRWHDLGDILAFIDEATPAPSDSKRLQFVADHCCDAEYGP